LTKGEVHAIVGENGAGKSTLMKLLGGVHDLDKGVIILKDKKVEITSPADSIALGVSIIYQEFNLAAMLSAAENIYLGKELHKGKKAVRLDRQAMFAGAREVMSRLGMDDIDVKQNVAKLSVARRQLVEIGKALLNDSIILVMDEPTAVLTERETKALFNVIMTLKSQQISIIYISHRLEEVQQIADRITVLRDGKFITTLDNISRTVEKNEIVKHMVGRDLGDYYPDSNCVVGTEVVFRTENYTKKGMFNNINISIRKGEILGLSGLVGAGRTELAKTIFGEYHADSGSIWLNERELTNCTISDSISNGIMLVPEDRAHEGLILGMNVADNISLPNTKMVSRFGVFIKKLKLSLANRLIKDVSIRPELPLRKVSDFSGGNQQKTVIAKWLASNPSLLLLDEPTRGVDVGAKVEIYTLMRKLTEKGVSILFISSEMLELLGMCDRLLVMHDGRITGEFMKGKMDQHEIMRAAAGLAVEEGTIVTV